MGGREGGGREEEEEEKEEEEEEEGHGERVSLCSVTCKVLSRCM